ncbi:hypothetical protein HRI_002297500 [Hibiscus trionum]|uniref:Integrase zinc-binding domain-containing protein n=1 Tax=Hibiscus trionum TaxID=183268 RepID=A0A9W7M1Q7_HIBTR|nr:hypothetical protein HRI_002297500 [Hibiscus trionum]
MVKDYVTQCDICQRTKSEHVPPPGLLQPLPIPQHAREVITMDFVEGLPPPKSSIAYLSLWTSLQNMVIFYHSPTPTLLWKCLELTLIRSTSYIDTPKLLSLIVTKRLQAYSGRS